MLRRLFQLRNSPGKARERLLQRSAAANGYYLIKLRTREVRAEDSGAYALVDPARGTLELADRESGCGLSVEELEAFLTEASKALERARVR